VSACSGGYSRLIIEPKTITPPTPIIHHLSEIPFHFLLSSSLMWRLPPQ
jgi:hypothetical protein